MNDFYIGIITTVVVIAITELIPKADKRLIGSLTLMGIAFIYIGFSWSDVTSLIYSIVGVAVFFALAYFGYKRNFVFISTGLVLHGVWDMAFPIFSSTTPDGYGIFCLTIDVLLAIYFYIRIKQVKSV